jgi:D-alanyl-D-alanine-carboxypeptidase/D-alanyl-D-alanine-endopeptidase
MMQRIFLGFSIILGCFTSSAQTEEPKTNLLDRKMDSIIKNYMDNPAYSGLSIAVYADKKVTYYNYGNVKKGVIQKPTNKTIYEIGSISKTFTGILFAKAILDKKMALNDPVKKYLGDDYKNLAYGGKNIELVHLANHSSRIHRIPFDLMSQPGYDINDPYKNYSKEMVLAYMKKLVPDTFPGVKSEYSNLGMGLLGMIEEKVYDKSYEELITETICRPLGMNDTKITISGADTARFAKGHDTEGKQVPYWNLGAIPGAGGIRSTTEDMMKYLKANLEESDDAIKLSHLITFNDDRNKIALAWHITTTKKGNELIWHNGRTAGFSSFCGFIKSKDVAVVILSNSGNPVDPIAIGVLKILQ